MIKSPFILSFIFFLLINGVIANTPEIAKESYELANQKIEIMQQQGYPTLPLYDILSNAQTSFNNKNYNYSDYLSKQVLLEGDKIIELQDELVGLTEEIETLSSFGIDMTQLDIKLLYTKSDYEAANIGLAREQADEISKELKRISLNHSKGLYLEISDYRKELDAVNESISIFEEYYDLMERYYRTSDFRSFLSNYGDFEIIKEIILQNETYEEYETIIKEKNLSFDRADDLLLMVSDDASLKNYEGVLDSYKELNNLAKLSIELDKKINEVGKDIIKIQELGLMDKDAEELYNKTLKEYALENFKDSERSLEDLKNKLSDIERENLIFQSFNKAKIKKTFTDFLEEHWIGILVFLTFIFLTHNFFKNIFLFYFHDRSLIKNSSEIEVLIFLQKSLQKQYFLDKIMDKKDYDADFQEYEDRKIDLGNKVSLSRLKIRDLVAYFKKLDAKMKKIPLVNKFELTKFYEKSNSKVNS